MKSTGYLPLQTLGIVKPNTVGSICRWWYTPIQNILSFPSISPVTQQLTGHPSLKPGTTWYGPVKTPDEDRAWKQTRERAKAGPWQKQQLTGFIDGIDANSHINLNNLVLHQLCVVALPRSGHFFIILGNDETGMDLDDETNTGENQFGSPGTKLSLNWEGEALVLPHFNGIISLPSPGAGAPSGGGAMATNVNALTYICTGLEGSALTLPALAGKTILEINRENIWLDMVSAAPASIREVQRSGTSLTFFDALTGNERIKILYR
jgi:hypothetical protein